MAQKKHRDYQNKLPSVTTVLNVISSQGLIEWYKRTPYKDILEKSNRGKQIGREIHECIQDHIEKNEAKIDTQYPNEVMTALKSFMKFKEENRDFILKKAEIAMTSQKYKYNGTIDCIAQLGDELVLIDWKTGECKDYNVPAIYDNYIWQVSAYFNLWNENEEDKVTKAYILAIAKDSVAYNLEEIKINKLKQSFKNVFLSALKIYNFKKGDK